MTKKDQTKSNPANLNKSVCVIVYIFYFTIYANDIFYHGIHKPLLDKAVQTHVSTPGIEHATWRTASRESTHWAPDADRILIILKILGNDVV